MTDGDQDAELEGSFTAENIDIRIALRVSGRMQQLINPVSICQPRQGSRHLDMHWDEDLDTELCMRMGQHHT